MKVVKKDNTKEEFNVQKVVVAVNKSAFRALVKFTDEELDFNGQRGNSDFRDAQYSRRRA